MLKLLGGSFKTFVIDFNFPSHLIGNKSVGEFFGILIEILFSSAI